MAATETRSSDGVVYVKRDLYPPINSTAMEDDEDIEQRQRHRRRCDDDDDDVDHRPPVLKLARYAISPTVPSLLSLHHHHHHNGYMNGNNVYGDSHQMTSPIPRRKQARPRRRSGDSSSSPPASAAEHHANFNFRSTPSPVQDMPEDLSVKKSSPSLEMERQESEENQSGRNSNDQDSHRSDTPLPVPSLKADSVNSDSAKSEFSLAERNSLFSPGPSGTHGPMTTPPMLSNSILSMTPIHQSDRRKGQHSAPRGGPPRAWTNGDLTEALNHVWNRKMTTSQASRVFGIPYNSLLMYVRGKYGKSLKLDTLRKETLEGEAMALAASTRGSYKLAAAAAAAAAAASGSPTGGSSNNNSTKTKPPKESGGNKSAPATPSPTASTKNVNNNNNNNNNTMNNHNHKNHNNNNDVKLSKNGPAIPGPLNLAGVYPQPQHRLNEMEALGMAGLAHAAGLGGFGGVNPYLSYFCDFSFPMPMGLGAGLLQAATGAATGANKQHRAVVEHQGLLKKSVKSPSKHHRAKKSTISESNDSKIEKDADDGGSSPPLRLTLPMIQTPMDRHQTGQV